MNGMKRVKRVIDKFTNLVEELDKGVAELEGEISFNDSMITGLQTKNTELSGIQVTATNVAKNLRKIIDD